MKRRTFLQSTGWLTTMGYLANTTPFRSAAALTGQDLIDTASPSFVSVGKEQVMLENQFTRFSFDLKKGTYSITDKLSGTLAVSDAVMRINDWRSDDALYKKTWKKKRVKNPLGDGLALEILLEGQGLPQLKFGFTLFHQYGFIQASAGIINQLDQSVQVKDMFVMADAALYPQSNLTENFAMVDGFSGGEPLEYGERMYSPLSKRNALKSRNNIMLTFTEEKKRRVAVLGGLRYQDFEKFAWIEQARKIELEMGRDGKKSLLCYLNLPFDRADQHPGKELLRVEKDLALQQWSYREFRCEETATSGKAEEEITVFAENLVADKKYFLGFSCWNGYMHGNHEDNHQSLFVEYTENGKLKREALLDNYTLPRFDGAKKKDVEQCEIPLPAAATAAGSCKLIITKGSGTEKDRNVYVNEIWLRDGNYQPLYPSQPTEMKDCASPRISYRANLFARDPVGKRIDPGVSYQPSDCFYIDVQGADPFMALEAYGKRVSIAQEIALSMYDFPTVCLWYAEQKNYGNSGAENSTVGAVKEMECIRKAGFLNYSRVAVRLVPDSYLPDNQQGWWDDEHWQREVGDNAGEGKHGRYLAPYETSEKWGKAVTALGGIPLTYFQTSYRSEDYAKTYPGHMLFNKQYAWRNEPVDTASDIFTTWEKTWVRNGRVVWGYDYTDPSFLEHLTRVYQNLHKGGIKGLMFDYPGSGWAAQGGMEDQYATTAQAYRNIFKYASEGLGPGAYVHERNMERGSDVSIGLVASMRTENDTDEMDHITVTRCGLRWYKNRVLVNQDTDSKNIVRLQGNRDKVRAVLTMAYVVSGRFLLANSFSKFSAETLWDLTRTFPFHTANQSARPADAFVSEFPMVYDFEISDQWHQVTFYNPDADREKQIGIILAGDRVDGSLALNKNKSYYIYDFWNDRLVGRLPGTAKLEQLLRPGEARMMAVREALDVPQVLSTNRHLMQGYLDLKVVKWNQHDTALTGICKVVANDPYLVVIATNGHTLQSLHVEGDQSKIAVKQQADGLLWVRIDSPVNADLQWEIKF